MMITSTTRTTPQASLEIIYNIQPLDIYLKEMGLAAYVRLKPQLVKPWANKLTFAKPHLKYWDDVMKDAFIDDPVSYTHLTLPTIYSV